MLPRSRPFQLFLCVLGSCQIVYAVDFAGGTGEPNDPYQVATAEQLIALGESPLLYDRHFLLVADIDLDPNLPGRRVFDQAVIAPDQVHNSSWHFDGTPFTGVFDGGGHTVKNLTIVGKDYLGLFGQIGPIAPLDITAELKALAVVDVLIIGSGDYIGALVGNAKGVFSACHSSGRIEGSRYVGGLAGSKWGIMKNCSSAGIVSGEDRVGGLLGSSGWTLSNCHSNGSVTGEYSVGGLVGVSTARMDLCYSTGVVAGIADVGGLAGANGILGARPHDGSIDRCYSHAAVTGEEVVGGLVGRNAVGSLRFCYSSGRVDGQSYTGGLIGSSRRIYSSMEDSFWNVETSGQDESDGGVGLTTAEMQTTRPYLDVGWDFLGESQNGVHETWQIPQTGGYPEFAILNGYTPPQLQGNGTSEFPYLITNAHDLGIMVHYPSSASYRMTDSIDMSAIRWPRAIIPEFGGTFDGGGHTLLGLTIAGHDSVGLFKTLTSDAIVKDLGVLDCHITGTGHLWKGGLVGRNLGQVIRCFVSGFVAGGDRIGGLVGGNEGRIVQCYTIGQVHGSNWLGGLVYYNAGHIERCYSGAQVSGVSFSGGLVGEVSRDGGTVARSFWDTDVSGQIRSAGGMGLPTDLMRMKATFLSSGWDFIGETTNGTDDIWWINEGQDYPRLSWEIIGDGLN